MLKHKHILKKLTLMMVLRTQYINVNTKYPSRCQQTKHKFNTKTYPIRISFTGSFTGVVIGQH